LDTILEFGYREATAKKLKIPWPEIQRALELIDNQFPAPLPLTRDLHRAGLALCPDHRVAFYDALIVAAAIEAGCDRLYSEDLQHGRRFGDCVVVNPFRDGGF
jgi:predicted nucleic acid-binding protein